MSTVFERVVGLRDFPLGGAVRREVATPTPRLRYSALPSAQTPLPEGLRPTSLLQRGTGSLVLGELLGVRTVEIERTVRASVSFVEVVAAALPTDAEDERLIDALMAKKTAGLARRPLRRRSREK